MEAHIKSKTGENVKSVKLPQQFSEDVRPDLIRRAYLAIQSHKRQPYGSKPDAGKRASAKLSRRRRDYKTAYGIGISRVPRKTMNHRGTRFFWVGAFAPSTVGGRRAHPPKVSKIWDQKINLKERRKAIRSALSATVIKDYVQKRGHIVQDYPIILENAIEDISKTKEVIQLLEKLGLAGELARVSEKRMQSGKAKYRGRRYKTGKGPLFVVSKECEVMKAAGNVPGVECVVVTRLNAELLAPGSVPGRLTLYTAGAIEKMEKEHLFTDAPQASSDKKQKESKK